MMSVLIKNIRYLCLLSGLFYAARIDCRQKRIPNELLFGLWKLRLVLLIMEAVLEKEQWMDLCLSSTAGFLMGGGLLFLCYLLSGGALGGADVKLFAVIGFYLGSRGIIPAMGFSLAFAAVDTIVKLLLKKMNFKEEIPLGPFVFLGTAAAMIFGA